MGNPIDGFIYQNCVPPVLIHFASFHEINITTPTSSWGTPLCWKAPHVFGSSTSVMWVQHCHPPPMTGNGWFILVYQLSMVIWCGRVYGIVIPTWSPSRTPAVARKGSKWTQIVQHNWFERSVDQDGSMWPRDGEAVKRCGCHGDFWRWCYGAVSMFAWCYGDLVMMFWWLILICCDL